MAGKNGAERCSSGACGNGERVCTLRVELDGDVGCECEWWVVRSVVVLGILSLRRLGEEAY